MRDIIDGIDGSKSASATRGRRTGVVALGVVALALLFSPAQPAHAEAPDWTAYSLTGTLLKPGQDRAAFFGARVDLVAYLPLGVQALGRLDASQLGDGAAADLASMSSFSTLEAFAGAWRPILRGKTVASGVGPVAVYGWTMPLEGGRPAIVERYPRTLLLGAMLRTANGWILAGWGFHEASGTGNRFLFAAQQTAVGRASVGADGAIGGSSFVRVYALVKVGGSAR